MSPAKLKLKCQLGLMRTLLRTQLKWQHTTGDRPGYSIVLGVPWMLRELLEVNLRFVAACDLTDLDAIHIVFDRTTQPEGEALIEQTRAAFPNLPLVFHFHPNRAGKLIQWSNNASLFACMNWTLGLRAARTRFVVLHDFDLYPIEPAYFRNLYRNLRDRQLHFTANERTYFDGLTDEDNILGTWSLGIDADWLRNRFKPVHCFHAVAKVFDRWTSLDGLTHIETQTDLRALCDVFADDHAVHVTNLCSVYRRYRSGQDFDPVWRLHLLWYLQHLAGDDQPMRSATDAMTQAASPQLAFDSHRIDFSRSHHTCGNVVRDCIERMERALQGDVRQPVVDYLAASDAFWSKFGHRDADEPPTPGDQPDAVSPQGTLV